MNGKTSFRIKKRAKIMDKNKNRGGFFRELKNFLIKLIDCSSFESFLWNENLS